MMRSQIYLVLIRDGRLALAVGAALEDRLLRDGHGAMAVVPTVRGPEFAASDGRRHLGAWRTGSAADRGPQVVALYEDGLLESLATLGLPAYVGVRDSDEPRIARWADGLGAIMVPVGTARDLVDAVADHTPWSQHAAGLPPARYRAGKAAAFIALGGRQAGRDGQPPQSRRIVAAAVPLLLAGLPTIAMAAGVGQAPVVASGEPGRIIVPANSQPAAFIAASPAPTTAASPTSDTVTGAGSFIGVAGNTFLGNPATSLDPFAWTPGATAASFTDASGTGLGGSNSQVANLPPVSTTSPAAPTDTSNPQNNSPASDPGPMDPIGQLVPATPHPNVGLGLQPPAPFVPFNPSLISPRSGPLPIRATPLQSLNPGTPVTFLPAALRFKAFPNPNGDFFPDGSPDAPPGSGTGTKFAMADTGTLNDGPPPGSGGGSQGEGNGEGGTPAGGAPADGSAPADTGTPAGGAPADGSAPADTGTPAGGASADGSGGSLTDGNGGAPAGSAPAEGAPADVGAPVGGGIPVGGIPEAGDIPEASGITGMSGSATAAPVPQATPITPIDDTSSASLGGGGEISDGLGDPSSGEISDGLGDPVGGEISDGLSGDVLSGEIGGGGLGDLGDGGD